MRGALEDFDRTFWKDMSDSIRKKYRDKSDKFSAMTVDF